MVTVELNERTAEDVKAIQAMRELGFSDKEIQEKYDKEIKDESKSN